MSPSLEPAACKRRGPAPIRAARALPDVGAFISQNASTLGWVAAAVVVFAAVFKVLQQGSRKYDGNVGDEYDAWTREGILEHYWGEHIHLGYYTDEDRQPGFFAWGKKDFKQVCGTSYFSVVVRSSVWLTGLCPTLLASSDGTALLCRPNMTLWMKCSSGQELLTQSLSLTSGAASVEPADLSRASSQMQQFKASHSLQSK